jgi:DNA-binding response OmpR family regulator
MDDYLAKPFDPHELHMLLEKWCGAAGRTHVA